MYLCRDAICPNCQQTKDIKCHSGNSGRWCQDCIREEEEKELRQYTEAKEILSVRERLYQIELWIYKHEKNPPRSFSDIMNTPL